MYGGYDDDSYYVDTATDRAIEEDYPGGGSQGADTVYSTSSFTLEANVEILALVGTTAANGTGNAGLNNLDASKNACASGGLMVH